MITRLSTLFLRTLREDPADAEVPRHGCPQGHACSGLALPPPFRIPGTQPGRRALLVC